MTLTEPTNRVAVAFVGVILKERLFAMKII
jgi:hypothetical protein